jgi:hypothetical protein
LLNAFVNRVHTAEPHATASPQLLAARLGEQEHREATRHEEDGGEGQRGGGTQVKLGANGGQGEE